MYKRLKKLVLAQRGAASPFMLGLLLGVSIFSISVQQQARIELQEIRKTQALKQEKEANALRNAVEMAIMTETTADYMADMTNERIREYLSYSGGTTRTNQDLAMRSNAHSGDLQASRIIMTTSDDQFVRDAVELQNMGGMTDSDLNKRSDVIVVDTKALRQRQIEASYENMEALAGLVYDWWSRAGNYRFPSSAQFNAEVLPFSSYTDFWGREFDYTYINDNQARLEFTTPWAQDYAMNLTMN